MNLHLKNSLVISFCISTFNRSEKIVKLVNDILKYEGDDIEVVVSDNCSTDNTVVELSKIDDKRFRYIINSPNIGAIPNYMKAISEGNAEYVFFSTDKDSINPSGIFDLINFFENHSYVVAGLCKLDVYKKQEEIIFDKGLESLLNVAYLSQHPTGYFFKNHKLKSLEVVKNFSDTDKVGVFPFEFILGELCTQGKTAVVKLPLFYMETMEEVKNIKSYSYSGSQNNLYFTPFKRFEILQKYISHVSNLNLTNNEKKSVIKLIFQNGLSAATLGYKLMIENDIVCQHYGIVSKKMGFFKVLRNDFIFSMNFLSKLKQPPFFDRFIICVEVHFAYIIRKF